MKKYLLFLAAFLAGCGAAGGGGSSGSLKLIATSFVSGQVLHINERLEFHFDKPIDIQNANFSTISIVAKPPTQTGAPIAGPASGVFFLKPESEGKILVFQPSCPLASDMLDNGLVPGNAFGPVVYEVSSSTLRATDGSELKQPFSFSFQTPSPPSSPFLDPNPYSPPYVVETEFLPSSLGLNLALDPISPILVHLDQPVRADSIQNSSVRLEFSYPGSGLTTVIPCSVSLVSNCNELNQAVLAVVPQGILPVGQTVRFYLAKEVQGFGSQDTNLQDLLFHTATVTSIEHSPQRDAILEEFSSSANFEESPALLVPLAKIENGLLESSTNFLSNGSNNIEIEIGPETTNGGSVYFSTNGGILKDTNGVPHYFEFGVIEVSKFRMKAPANGETSILKVTGSNALTIRCAQTFVMESGSQFILDGQDAIGATGTHVANFPSPGGVGNSGGGDGGAGSPLTNASDPKGADGNGPFNITGLGGKGGHTGYGSTNPGQNRSAGGGGGNWGIKELDGSGNWTTFCYSSPSCSTPGCAQPLSSCPTLACDGLTTPPNSLGESGASGVATSLDAILATTPASAGDAGTAIFADGLDNNNFVGKKPSGNGFIDGELTSLLGGQGGGGGGDNALSTVFPTGDNFFNDMRGGGGGGGGGALKIQALGVVILRGTISTKGGSGAQGELIEFNSAGAGGGGGGAGGMISVESNSQIVLGFNSSLLAIGGNRGRGGGNIPGASGGGSLCRKNTTSGHGGAGGKGVIQFHLPFDPSTLSDCDGDGNPEPAIQNGALLVETNSLGATQPVTCERSSLFNGHLDPKPNVLIPTLGLKSAVLSKWFNVGFASISSPPQFEFSGIDSNGFLDPAWTQTLATGNGGTKNGGSVVLENAALADLIRSEPKILIQDLFQPNSAATNFSILNVTVTGNTVTLFLDATNLPAIQDWKILRRNFQSTLNGEVATSLNGNSTKILFEAAEETFPGSRVANMATVIGPTANMNLLTGKSLLRFRVEFDMNSVTDTAGLQFLKIPYKF